MQLQASTEGTRKHAVMKAQASYFTFDGKNSPPKKVLKQGSATVKKNKRNYDLDEHLSYEDESKFSITSNEQSALQLNTHRHKRPGKQDIASYIQEDASDSDITNGTKNDARYSNERITHETGQARSTVTRRNRDQQHPQPSISSMFTGEPVVSPVSKTHGKNNKR